MKVFFFFLILFNTSHTWAVEDPTNGKPFLPWVWEDQLRPTIESSISKKGLITLGATTAATVGSLYYDTDVYEHNRRGKNLVFDQETSGFLGTLGGGGLGVGIAALQLFFDQQNGLKHGRAIMLTSFNHVVLAFAFSRKRPDGRPDYLPFDSAFPSGHSSSIFATATSLSYAYGWLAGVPAFTLATAISAARVSENTHWLSDVVAGAGIGMFWATASYNVSDKLPGEVRIFPPVLLNGGAIINASVDF